MAGASSCCYCIMGTPGTGPTALAVSFYQRSGCLAFQHTARTSWHSSTLAPESPAPPVTAQPGQFSPNTAGPARCWARTWICPSFIFFSSVQPPRRAPRSDREQLCRKEAFRFLASQPRQKEKSKCKHTLFSSCSSSSPSHALAPPLQPLIKEIPPSTYGSPGR